MPAFIKTKEDEKQWQRARDAVVAQYGDIEEKDPEKFFSITTTIYKSMCKKHGCSPFKNESVSSMSSLLERIAKQSVTSTDTNKERLLKFYNNYKAVSDQIWKDGTDKNSEGYLFMQDNPKVLEKWRGFRDSFDAFLRAVWDAGKHIDIKVVHSSVDVNEGIARVEPADIVGALPKAKEDAISLMKSIEDDLLSFTGGDAEKYTDLYKEATKAHGFIKNEIVDVLSDLIRSVSVVLPGYMRTIARYKNKRT